MIVHLNALFRHGLVWLVVGLTSIDILVALPLSAAESVTVDQAVAIALQKNPDLLATRQQLVSAQARLMKAEYWNQFNPQVEGGATQAQFGFAPGGTAAQPSGSVSLEVEVAGQRGKRIAEAQQNLTEAKAQVNDAERLTTGRAKSFFYQGLYFRQRFELAEQFEDLNRRVRDAAVIRFHSGETAKLDADLAAVRYDQSRKVTLLARRDYENGLRALQRAIGMTPTGALELVGSFGARTVEINPSDALQIARANRPDLRAREYEIKRVDAEIALTKRLIFPNPVITGLFGQSVDTPGQRVRAFGGSLGFSIPVFDHKQAELAALGGERLRSSYDRAATQLTVEEEVRDAVAAYDAARETLDFFESDAIGKVKDGFALIQTSYRSGKIDLLQLIVVENDLVTANSSYLDSQWDYWVARIAVETATGADLEKLATR